MDVKDVRAVLAFLVVLFYRYPDHRDTDLTHLGRYGPGRQL